MKRCCVLLAATPASAVFVVASSVVLHGTVLVAVAGGAGLAALLAYALRDDDPAASIDAAWKSAAAVFAVSVVTAGLGVVAGGPAAAVFVLIVAAVAGAAWLRWYLRGLVRERRELDAGPDEDHEALGEPLHRFSVPVSLLPTAALGSEWQRTRLALESVSEPAAWEEVVRRRRALLDEIERRDPCGFARWLADGAPSEGGPGTFLHG